LALVNKFSAALNLAWNETENNSIEGVVFEREQTREAKVSLKEGKNSQPTHPARQSHQGQEKRSQIATQKMGLQNHQAEAKANQNPQQIQKKKIA